MRNRVESEDFAYDIFDNIQNPSGTLQYGYPDLSKVRTSSVIYEDFLAIAYVILELDGIPDLL